MGSNCFTQPNERARYLSRKAGRVGAPDFLLGGRYESKATPNAEQAAWSLCGRLAER
jgi:hypothetical protein